MTALSGDGGLAMLLGELLTLRQQRLPVKVVVFNNGALAFVESFADLARAAGLYGVRVEHPGELDDALRDAFAHDGPAVVDVLTSPQELAIPPTLEIEPGDTVLVWTRDVSDNQIHPGADSRLLPRRHRDLARAVLRHDGRLPRRREPAGHPAALYLLSSLVVDLKISEIVDGGQYIVSALLPEAIFV